MTTEIENNGMVKNTPRKLISSLMGVVRLQKEIEHTRLYEFAAWSTKLKAVVGTYNVFAGIDPYNHINPLRLYAEVSAVVTDDNCAPHFGGVAFAPASKDRVGKPDTFTLYFDALTAIHSNRCRFTDNADYAFDLDLNTEMGREFCRTALNQSNHYVRFCNSALDEALKTARTYHRLCSFDFGMVAHYAKEIDMEIAKQNAAQYTMDGKNTPEAAVTL